MHGEISDTFSTIHRGTKVRKFHTSRRDAFQTVNDLPLGKVENGVITLDVPYWKKTIGPVATDTNMEEDVRIIYFHPGMKPEAITEKKGLVLTGTGLSHVSTILLPRIIKLIKNGSVIIMTSQCLFGRVNMRVYSAGRDLIKSGVISAEDMLPETAYLKLMWALAYAKTKQEVEQLMMMNIAGEIVERMKRNAFIQQNN